MMWLFFLNLQYYSKRIWFNGQLICGQFGPKDGTYAQAVNDARSCFLSSRCSEAVAVPSFADKVSITGPTGSDPPSICDAIASNLVANCGFETGDFTDWSTSNLNASGVESFGFDEGPNSGSFFAALGNVGSDGTISQTLSTVIGQPYTISFYFASDGGTPNDFSALLWIRRSVFERKRPRPRLRAPHVY
jgi:hypothetical protein